MIDSDIKRARTLPAKIYRDPEIFEAQKEQIFARSWQLVADLDKLTMPGHALPHTMLEGFLNEPILVTRDNQDNLHCLSNVCTHRGSLLVEGECHTQSFRCRYHGRRFGLDGCFLSTPGFDNVPDFPTSADNLSKVPSATWGKFMFASINPAFSFDELIGDMRKRTEWMPLDKFIFDPARAQNYITKANWALYVDNYLEGFHVPYVHPALATALDTRDYVTELYPYSNMQLGVAANPADSFTLPESSPDFGKHIAAYYYWVFPNMMFNFYPWGLSVNIVTPLAPDRTRITFLPYVWDESKIDDGAGSNLDRTEREDENIVELVQKGVQSRFYERGRYSPAWEPGPHHFHGLLSKFLSP
ncbi:MAG: aromatic ring-hydroxylating dioxygenase subunit alpha [Candidatus Obscuribacterales bacterium]|nr:aromatic ring-hydroxylating dioxygenase subunit alpha [Candidatus Obscuribacterales bacterium]